MNEFENKNLNLDENNETSQTPSGKIMYVPDKEVLNMGKKIKKENKKAEKVKTQKPKKEKAPKDPNKKFSFKELWQKIVFFIKNIIPKKTDDKKAITLKIVAIVAAVAILGSAVYLVYYFTNLGAQNAAIEDIRNIYELNRDDYSYNEDGQFSKFDVLKAQNSDIVGWVNIPGTQLDNPVYQTVDNEYSGNFNAIKANELDDSTMNYFIDYVESGKLTITQRDVMNTT